MGRLIEYYNGWLGGGFFYCLYEQIPGLELHEPWHTPVGFWVIHIGLALMALCLLGYIITRVIARG